MLGVEEEVIVSERRSVPPSRQLPFPHDFPAEAEPAAPPAVTLWGLVKPHVSRYRWQIALALVLNTVPGIGIALQTLAPKYLLDEVLIAPGLSPQTRVLRLSLLIAGWLFAALVLRMLAWYWS